VARRKQFRAWGLALAGAAALSFASDRLWIGAGFVAALVLYPLFMRPARCRVATNNGRPCPWAARGYLGSCKHHQGLKRGLPVVTASGSFGLPGLMWRRPWWRAEAQSMPRWVLSRDWKWVS